MTGVMNDKPKVSVVIPLFNRVNLTKDCWRSLLENSGGVSCEVIFIDNASTDGTGEFLESITESPVLPVTVISNSRNECFACACNQGARAARSDVVVFLNNDTIVHESRHTF